MLVILGFLQAAAAAGADKGYGLIGAGLAAGLAVVGAGIGIGQIGGNATAGIARDKDYPDWSTRQRAAEWVRRTRATEQPS